MNISTVIKLLSIFGSCFCHFYFITGSLITPTARFYARATFFLNPYPSRIAMGPRWYSIYKKIFRDKGWLRCGIKIPWLWNKEVKVFAFLIVTRNGLSCQVTWQVMWPPHGHRHTVTATRSPPHGHRHTATATWSPPHGHRHMITATWLPPHNHRHMATATWPPPHDHRHTA